jgi:hypothetical protein
MGRIAVAVVLTASTLAARSLRNAFKSCGTSVHSIQDVIQPLSSQNLVEITCGFRHVLDD